MQLWAARHGPQIPLRSHEIPLQSRCLHRHWPNKPRLIPLPLPPSSRCHSAQLRRPQRDSTGGRAVPSVGSHAPLIECAQPPQTHAAPLRLLCSRVASTNALATPQPGQGHRDASSPLPHPLHRPLHAPLLKTTPSCLFQSSCKRGRWLFLVSCDWCRVLHHVLHLPPTPRARLPLDPISPLAFSSVSPTSLASTLSLSLPSLVAATHNSISPDLGLPTAMTRAGQNTRGS
jgi:hypothetical protein